MIDKLIKFIKTHGADIIIVTGIMMCIMGNFSNGMWVAFIGLGIYLFSK